ncbi:MAG: hypothetical protein IKO53_08920 [Lachnospiraceae bacterium]|nr:hypothetical protein [Lachnospiraceae bacterium]
MSKIIPVNITTTEQAVALDATYQFAWLWNSGENDCLFSNHSGIVQGDDDVTLVAAGDVRMISTAGRAVYIKAVSGTSTGEIHAQNFAASPFKRKAKGGESITVTALNVTENDIYTAPSGTAYSPVTVSVSPNVGTKSIIDNGTYTASTDNLDGYSSVTVDTGIYTGATTPASTLGKDGDYYYQRTNDFGALILKDDVTYRSSSTTWIGFDFTTTKSISITKIKTRLSNPTSIIYRIATENEILYESDTIEGIAGENEITLATPLQLAANVTYTAYVILGTNYGYYYGISDVIGTGKTIVYNNGRYGENSSGTRPYKADVSYGYAVDFEYETDDAYIISEYHKKSGSWVEL